MDHATLDLNTIMVAYHWQFNVSIVTVHGRPHKHHLVTAWGNDYFSAKINLQNIVKKRRYQLLGINSVTITDLAMAVYTTAGNPSVPRHLHDQIPLPTIPEIL